MQEKTIKVYSYEELSDTAKDKALEEYNRDNDYPFLEEDLTEYLKEILEEKGIKELNSLEVLYSLSYSQGDGFSFVGDFEYKGVEFYLRHNSNHYYHYNTVDIEYYNEEEEENDDLKDDLKELIFEEFKELFYSICKDCEKEGYSRIEYEHSEENFKEICISNEYTFRENGEMENL